jgi:hypothetical protein
VPVAGSKSIRVNAISSPAGDQAGMKSKRPARGSVICVSTPPSASIATSHERGPRAVVTLRVNTMRFPSGDQAGRPSETRFVVRRRRCAPSASMT